MKILFVHLYDASFKIGGAEKVVVDLSAAMKTQFGDEVLCAVNDGDILHLLDEAGVDHVTIPWKKSQTFQTIFQLSKIIRDFQPDIIHSHHRYTTFLVDLFFKNQAPLLHTEHVLRQDKKTFFRYGHMANGVHASVTENLKEYFNVPEHCATTVPNAVTVPPPREEKLAEVQKEHPAPEGGMNVLFIGRFEEQKGHTYLIEAVAKLSKSHQRKLNILLAGDGSLEEPSRARIHDLGIQDCFTFLGHTDKVPELLAYCDFVILPSLWEGMPLSVLEAFAAKKAVLATDIPGTRELVRNDVTGLLVMPKDPESLAKGLVDFLDSPDKVRKMCEQAYEISQKEYSFEVMTKRYHDLYEYLLK